MIPDIPLITGPFLLYFIPGSALGLGLADKLEFGEYATNQVIRVIEPVMGKEGRGARAYSGLTRGQYVTNKNCRRASSLTARYGHQTVRDVPAFCLQLSLQQTWMGFISAQCLAVEAPCCQLTAYWLTSLLR